MRQSRFLLAFLGLLGLSLVLTPAPSRADDSLVLEEGDKPAKKPAKKKKKGYDYDKSKYKSKIEEPTGSYRFNEKGEPLSGEPKKKAAPKKKKKSEPPEVDPLAPEACGGETSCLEKKSDADAL
jgi:hypothetical protein